MLNGEGTFITLVNIMCSTKTAISGLNPVHSVLKMPSPSMFIPALCSRSVIIDTIAKMNWMAKMKMVMPARFLMYEPSLSHGRAETRAAMPVKSRIMIITVWAILATSTASEMPPKTMIMPREART